MGVMDSLQDAVNKGQIVAEKGLEKFTQNVKLKEANSQLKEAYARLGAALFEDTKGDSQMRARMGDLYSEVESLLATRDRIESELRAGDASAFRSSVGADLGRGLVTCTSCGAQVNRSDSFCFGCGKRIDEIIAEGNYVRGPQVCGSCGAKRDADALFCAGCGRRF